VKLPRRFEDGYRTGVCSMPSALGAGWEVGEGRVGERMPTPFSVARMREAILMLLLAIASSSAVADWVEVSHDETSVTYADPATIGRAGDVVKMWTLLDFKAPQARPYATPYISQKTLHEYDCKEQRARIVQFLRYSENMGGGEVVPTDSAPEEWKPVVTGSIVEKLRGVACKK
jgi:hypothetical protein